MGLDAKVYRSRRNLPFDPDALGAKLDPQTGEYFFENPDFDRKFSNECIAVHRRIGNMNHVTELREEASAVLEPNSIILSRVIHSGTHSSDSIPLTFIEQLQDELRCLERSQSRSEIMQQFIRDMNALVVAATAEGNPIIF